MSKLGAFINTRPLSVLGILFAIRGWLYGLGFGTSTPIAQNTFLWDILLEAHINPVYYGFAVMAMSLLLIIAFVLDSDRLVRYAGWANAVGYVLVTAAYLTQAEWLGAINQGLIWTLMVAYITYSYLSREYVVSHYQLKE